MKLKNISFISLALLSGVFATNCTDDIENFCNKIFMTESDPSTVLIKPTSVEESHEFTLSIPKPEGQDVTFTIAADASLVSAYENIYYTSGMEMLPADNYELSTTTGIIPAGSLNSDPIEIKFKGLDTIDDTKTYVLPVTVTSCSIDILASNKTQYYVVRKGALIDVVPDITKNAIYTDAWATPEKFKLNKLTAEALIYPTVFGDGHESGISTLMGTESGFLLRFGDAGVEPNILQIATKAGNFAVSRAVNLNTWTHVAVTYDSEAKEIYVYFNGVEIDHFTGVDAGTVDWSPEHSNDNDGKPRSFWVGHSYNDNRWFEGRISEVRVWDKVLTKDEINTENHFYVLEEPENEENLILYWKLCDNQTNDVKDYSQYGNNGVFQKEATWVEVSLPATNE